MSFLFNEAARVEHLEHVAYYEEQRRGLGARYLAAFEAAMVKVCENPTRYRVELAPDIAAIACRVFLTTSFIGSRAQTSRFLLLRPIVVVRAIGLVGSNTRDRDEPQHVYIERDDKIGKFWLDPIRLQSSGGVSRVELARIEKLVNDHRVELVETWHDYFGH